MNNAPCELERTTVTDGAGTDTFRREELRQKYYLEHIESVYKSS